MDNRYILAPFNGTKEQIGNFYKPIFNSYHKWDKEHHAYEIECSLLKYNLFPYQEEAVAFCLDKKSALLRLCCGAGKTFIGIATYARARGLGMIQGPAIVIVKASLKTQWAKEVVKFSYMTSIVVQTKSQIKNRISKKGKTPKQIESEVEQLFKEQFTKADFLVLNYEALTQFEIREAIRELKPEFVFSDESHYIKNADADRTKAVYELCEAKIKIASTATPIQKNWVDVYGIFRFIVPTLWASFSKFAARHIIYSGYGKIGSFKNVEELKNRVSPYIFTKTEEDIGDQLPKAMPPIALYCRLDTPVQQMSDTIMADLASLKEQEQMMLKRFGSKKEYDESTERMQLEAQIMALQTFAQEIADSPELINNSPSKMAQNYVIKGTYKNAKMDLLLKQVDEIIDSGEKVCIFSRFEKMQDIFEKVLHKQYPKMVIAKASGKVVDKKRFEEVYDKFRDNDACKILLASDALAEGVNLSCCKYIIEYDLAESYAVQKQRHGRIRRADSKHDMVFVYQMLAEDSYDEIAQKIVNKKERMHDEL